MIIAFASGRGDKTRLIDLLIVNMMKNTTF